MIHEQSIAAIKASRFGEHFVRPLYESYSFARLPQTLRSLFGLGGAGVPTEGLPLLQEQYDAVIVLLADAFGWSFFERQASLPFLRRVVSDGAVCKLTSQFPSTTSAHVTTIHTGLPLIQSGVYEWYYYEPQLDAVIAPLLYSFAGDKERETLVSTGVAPEELFPNKTLYQDLAAGGVDSFVIQKLEYANSPYSRVVTDGAQTITYRTLPEALVTLCELATTRRTPSYYFLYFEGIDATCHTYGPNTSYTDAEIGLYFSALEQILHPRLSRTQARTLLLVIADHGQTAISPKTTMYLNQIVPHLTPLLRTDHTGNPLVPAGSSRDMFLYVHDDRLGEAEAMLRNALAGRAEVHRTANLLADGLFGLGHPAPQLLTRLGNLVILPYAGESVWWYEKGRFAQRFRGNHGGMLAEELETPLIMLEYGR